MGENKKDAIIILGAGFMQIPAIRTAEEKGYKTLVFDGNPDAAGKEETENFINIDIKDFDHVYRICESFKDRYVLKGVFTAGTDFSYIVAKLSEKLSLPGIGYDTAVRATLKSEMRKAFRNYNVNSPRFVIADKPEDAEKQLDNLSLPIVVKPVDSMGGRGSVKIDCADDLAKAVEDALGYSRTGKAIIEEFIEGAEFSLDAVVENNEIKICGIADRHIFFPPYFVEMGHTMPSSYPENIQKEVIEVFRDGIKAIGIDNGTAKGDIKHTGEKAVVGEIAARLSGGYMSGWTFPYSTGVSVTDAAINIAVNRPSDLPSYEYLRTAAERAFISIPGRVGEIIIPSYIMEYKKNDNCIKELFLNIKSGDHVVFPKNNVQKCGNVIAVDEKREKAVYTAEKACRDIIVRLQPCVSATEDFLFNSRESWIPDAFTLKNSENRRRLESMPRLKTGKGKGVSAGIAIFPIPDAESEDSMDWQGRTLHESIEAVSGITGIEWENPGKEYEAVLGTIFWEALIRGGIQGGLWIIDTVLEYIEQGGIPDRFL